ncbi:MAG: substrate-binding domain-containing protein [Thermoleophilia bacterium]
MMIEGFTLPEEFELGSLFRRFFLLFFLIMVPLAGASCSDSESLPSPSDTVSTSTPADIRISIAGMFTPKETYAIYSELLDYIGEKTGRSTVLQQTGSYSSTNDLLARKETDFALLCSGGYVEASHHMGLVPLVAPVVNGQPLYYSYILAREDSGIQKFEDFRGRRFAFGDTMSLTGTLYPMWRIRTSGARLEDFFGDYIYTSNHDNSIKAVMEGVVDGTAVDSLIFDYLKARNPASVEGLVIIEKSQPFGSPPIVARPGLPKDILDQVILVLVGMQDDPQGREILAQLGIERFVQVDESLYESIEQLEAEVTISQ